MQNAFDQKALGQRIRHFAQQKSLTQENLALLLGVATATVRRWMLGETAPDLHNLVRLAELFEVSLDALVWGKPVQSQEPIAIHYRGKPIIMLDHPPRDAYEELGLRIAQLLFDGHKPASVQEQLRIPSDTYLRALTRLNNGILSVDTEHMPLDEALAKELQERFHLGVCRVADLGEVEPVLKTVVLGALGAKEIIDLSRQSEIRLRVGFAGGFTCGRVIASLIQAKSLPRLDVIPIAVHSNERVVASDANSLVGMLGFFSRGTDLRVYGLPFVSNACLDQEPENECYETTRRMLGIARRVDVAFLGLGGDLNYFFYRKAELPPEEDMFCGMTIFDLQRKNCIGDILYTLVTETGPMEAFRQCCDQLICSIGLEGIARLVLNGSYVIAIVTGQYKLPVTRLALKRRYVNGLIMDSQLAQAVLESDIST